MTPPARLASAIELLAAIETDLRPADAVANEFFRARRFIGGGDRRAISDRVWTVLRANHRLRWWLDRAGADPSTRLMIGAAFLLDGGSLGGLEQTFSGGRFAPPPFTAAELAPLRRLAGHTLDHPAMPDPVRFEIPGWLLPLLAERFGPALPAEMAALLAPAPLDLRANLLKTTRDDARAALAAEGVATAPTRWSPWGLRATARQQVTGTDAFRSGLIEIQDEGSQLVALLANARPRDRVADLCAGAGGKTLAMAAGMDNRGHILACDVSATRLESAAKRLRRAGVHNAERLLLAPGDRSLKRRAGSFDRVLVDAPCTGTGTWRRNPDARRRLTPADLAELLPKQAAILDSAARLVRIGGRLIYATCSLLIEENEGQVSAFIARHPGFVVVSPVCVWPAAPAPVGDAMLLTPARHGTDGFFTAILERRE